MNNENDKAPLFKNDSEVDLLKSEAGFEKVEGNNVSTVIIEPQAETITSPEQLNTGTDPLTDSNLSVVDDDPMKLNTIDGQNLGIGNSAETNPTPEMKMAPPENQINEKKEPKKSGGGLKILLVIIIVIVALFAILYFVILTPKNIISKSLDTLSSDLNVLVTGGKKVADFTTIESTGKVTFNTTESSYLTLDGTSLDYDIGYDKINSKAKVLLSIKKETTSLLGITAFYKENTIYLDELLDKNPMVKYKYEKMNIDEAIKDKESVVTDVDYNYLISVIKTGLLNSISQDKLTRKIVYGEKVDKKLGIKLSYVLDKEEYAKVFRGIIDTLENDEKALEEITKIVSTSTSEETKAYLDEYVSSMGTDVPTTTIDLYLDPISNSIYYSSIKSEKEELTYSDNEGLIVFNYSLLGNDASSFKIEYNTTTKELNMDVTVVNDAYAMVSKYNLTAKITSTGDKNNIAGSFTMIADSDTPDSKNIINYDINYVFNETFKDPDVSSAVEATEEEVSNVLMSIMFAGYGSTEENN